MRLAQYLYKTRWYLPSLRYEIGRDERTRTPALLRVKRARWRPRWTEGKVPKLQLHTRLSWTHRTHYTAHTHSSHRSQHRSRSHTSEKKSERKITRHDEIQQIYRSQGKEAGKNGIPPLLVIPTTHTSRDSAQHRIISCMQTLLIK